VYQTPQATLILGKNRGQCSSKAFLAASLNHKGAEYAKCAEMEACSLHDASHPPAVVTVHVTPMQGPPL